jgi:hypothetical protein
MSGPGFSGRRIMGFWGSNFTLNAKAPGDPGSTLLASLMGIPRPGSDGVGWPKYPGGAPEDRKKPGFGRRTDCLRNIAAAAPAFPSHSIKNLAGPVGEDDVDSCAHVRNAARVEVLLSNHRCGGCRPIFEVASNPIAPPKRYGRDRNGSLSLSR